VYCGADLLRDRVAYSAAGVDHLLPQDKYEKLIQDKRNVVASCAACNATKAAKDVLEPGKDPEMMLSAHRDELIKYARQAIGLEPWEGVRATVRG